MERRQVLKNILCITAGAGLSSIAATSPVWHAVGQPEKIQVVNAGIRGNNTFDLLHRIDPDCLQKAPTLTVIMIGTNDMNDSNPVALHQYRLNLDEIILRVKAIGSAVVLLSILPFYTPYLLSRHHASFYEPEGVLKRRLQVNRVIQELAKKRDVYFLDTSLRFSTIGEIGLDQDCLLQNKANSNNMDGVHPTAMGYRFLALTIYDYILNVGLPYKNVVCFGDSITYGDGLKGGNSYPAYLLKLLTAVES